MSESDFVTSIGIAEVQTEQGDFHDVAVEIYRGWIKVRDDTGTRWIPDDKVVEIFERE